MINNDDGIYHSHKCGGIPWYPDESLYHEMKSRLNEDQLEDYKKLIEKHYGKYDIEFPWDNE